MGRERDTKKQYKERYLQLSTGCTDVETCVNRANLNTAEMLAGGGRAGEGEGYSASHLKKSTPITRQIAEIKRVL